MLFLKCIVATGLQMLMLQSSVTFSVLNTVLIHITLGSQLGKQVHNAQSTDLLHVSVNREITNVQQSRLD